MRILFFSPFARIIQHSIPEATIALELKKSGYTVEYLDCGEIYAGQCVVLDAMGLSSGVNKSVQIKTCQQCRRCSSKLASNSTSLATLVKGHTDIHGEIELILADITKENFADFNYQGYPLGRLASYQHMIAFKKFNANIEEKEWPVFLQELRNCLLTLFALRKWESSQRSMPDRAFVYNSYYSVNAVFRFYMERLGIPLISLHAGGNLYHHYDTMMMSSGHSLKQHNHLMSEWSKYSDLPLNGDETSWVASHFEELSRGRSVFVYSSGVVQKSISFRERWKISSDKKIILLAMSSYDERFAAEYVGVLAPSRDSIYVDQIEWLKEIIIFARNRSDIFFVIRLHPREFANKRESKQSVHSKKILDVLKDLPDNVRINTPSDQVSLYELARDVDLLLTAWSTVAKEFLLLGIPVVVFSADMQWFPHYLAYVANSRQEYFQLIEKALCEGRDLERSRLMFRWIAFESKRTIFLLTTSLSGKRSRLRKLWWRIAAKLDFSLLIKTRIGRVCDPAELVAFVKNPDLIPFSSDMRIKHNETRADETRFLLNSLDKIAVCFWGNKQSWPASFKALFDQKSIDLDCRRNN